MARPYRILGENAFYHITSHGNGCRSIYEGERDYLKFLEYLLQAKEKFQFRLYAYVLMTNHYHLLVQTLQANLSKIMHYINGAYTAYYNKTNKNAGHLFQGRYKSLIIDADNYFKKVTRYIHLNPVKAKMAERPQDYKWSSYRGYMSGKGDGYIDKEEIGKVLDMSMEEYEKFVCAGKDEKDDIFKEVYAGSILGSEGFIKETMQVLKGRIENKDIAYGEKLRRQISAEDVLEFVSREYKMGRKEILGSKNKQNQAKKSCIYLLRRITDKTNKEIGEMFGMGHTAVSKVCGKMEQEIESDKRIRKVMESQVSRFKG